MDETWSGPICDEPEERPILARRAEFAGRVWSVRTDEVDFGASGSAHRDVLLHPGAVAVIALDAQERVLLVRQYRHPVAMMLLEPPAGLLDHAGEPPLETAARELAEEAGYAASTWHVLVDLLNSPGGSSEAIRIYLARDLVPLPEGRTLTGEAEEAHLPRAWVPLDEARARVLDGSLGSPSAVAGILAACAARDAHWSTLRDAAAPWAARDRVIAADRLPR